MKSYQQCKKVKEHLYEGLRSLLERNLFYLYEGSEPRPRKGWEEDLEEAGPEKIEKKEAKNQQDQEETPGPEEGQKSPEAQKRPRGPETIEKAQKRFRGPEKIGKRSRSLAPGPEEAEVLEKAQTQKRQGRGPEA